MGRLCQDETWQNSVLLFHKPRKYHTHANYIKENILRLQSQELRIQKWSINLPSCIFRVMQPLIRATWQLFPSIPPFPGQDVCLISSSMVFCLGFVPHVMLLVNTVCYHSSTGNTIPVLPGSSPSWDTGSLTRKEVHPSFQTVSWRTLSSLHKVWCPEIHKAVFCPKHQILAITK